MIQEVHAPDASKSELFTRLGIQSKYIVWKQILLLIQSLSARNLREYEMI